MSTRMAPSFNSFLPTRGIFATFIPPETATMSVYDNLKFNADGLIPAIIQDAGDGRVLMMAWMNRASLETTVATGKTHFWSRSRQ